MNGNDTFAEDAAEEYLGLAERDDVLRQIRDLLAMQVRGGVGGEASEEWLTTTLAQDSGILDSEEDRSGTNREHFGGRVEISENKADPLRVVLPFEAKLLDLRDWSGTVYVSIDNPDDTNDSAIWAEYDGTNDDPVTEIPLGSSGKIWVASPDGSTVTPLIDAWRSGTGGI